jgi:glycosyltransferase involved in cell wall biosynthesis
MDLVADMLFQHLQKEQAPRLEVTRLCPALRGRFQRLPMVGRAGILHNADRLLNRFVDYPSWLKQRVHDFDLFHLVDHSYAQLVHDLPPGRTVVTCHDLDTFRCVLQPEREPRPRWFRAMTARILSGFQKAAHVVAVSASTRDEILRRGLIPPDRVTVVSNGVHPSCSPLTDPVAEAELATMVPSGSENAIWLLNVGSTMPRKRLDVLLRVFAEVRKRLANVRLLRVGGALTAEQRQLARQLGMDSEVVELGYLKRNVLAAAYRRADLLVHTAEAEGFGLPLVEAMACGCQVIASDLPVLREVGGPAAVYCAVGDIESWRDAVLSALQTGPDERKFGCERALANAARFSWVENTAQTAQIYDQVLRNAP